LELGNLTVEVPRHEALAQEFHTVHLRFDAASAVIDLDWAVPNFSTLKGGATTDGGDKIQIVGTWEVRGDKFCRVWTKLDGGKEICETWYLTSGRSVEVFNGKKRLGVNSW